MLPGRVTAALAVGAALAWLVASTGPAGMATAASTGTDTGTTTGTGAITRTETRTITEPATTDTVTETSTAQSPGNTTAVTNRTATVQVTPAGSTTSEPSSDSGLPWWGWALIGLGAALIGLVMFMVGRHRREPPSGPAGAPPPPGVAARG